MKAAVILSGCGHLDGAEIRESVLSLLYLDQHKVHASCFAPDKAQHHVIDHLSGNSEAGGRNILIESARIARGKVQPLTNLRADDFDMLIIPGGFGVAKNLSNLAFAGADAQPDPDFKRVVESFFAAKKPIAAICIAPAVLAVTLPTQSLTLTIGDDEATASIIRSLGHTHVSCASDEVCVDEKNRIVSCSAYMREDSLGAIARGIEATIVKSVAMAKMHHSEAA